MTNRLVQIGYLGSRTCYLNVSDEEAIQRFLESNPEFSEFDKTTILERNSSLFRSFEFKDSFGAYDVWSPE